jgi:general secretion pathway protein D
MEEPTAHINFPIRTAAMAIFWIAAMPLAAATPGAAELASGEQSRRAAAVDEAQMLLQKGDEAYQAARYDEAVLAYSGAREMIPDAPLTAELRAAATQRLAQASVGHARVLAGQGDVAAAKAAVDKVLADDVAPNDPAARDYRAQLDDPVRINPALTAEHAKNVDAVRRALYTAEGAFNLADFDKADGHYQEVLRIDPANSAARRGMERVAAAKSRYYMSAYDQSRAEMLAQVDAGWETPVTPTDEELGLANAFIPNMDAEIRIENKLKNIIIPRIALDQTTLEEAIDFLRVQSKEHDALESDPARRGLNITVNLGPADSDAAREIRALRFDLQLNNVPVASVLKYVTDFTRTSYSVDDYSVIIRPAGFTSDELVTRTYRVPPDFLTSLSVGAEPDAVVNDPFATPATGGSGLLTTRMSAQEALSKQGVTFPDGAFANYNAASNTLRVHNTAVNQDFIAQIVETISQTEPVQIAVRVTMILTDQTNLEELGFDWLVSPVALNSGDSIFGGGGTVGSGVPRTNADFISPVDFTSIPGVPSTPGVPVSNIATGGLRSGDQAITGNSIDSLINNPNRNTQTSSVAPGVLSVTGLFSDGTAQMILRGLSQKKGIDVMAKPSTVTRSGQASTITAVREFIYPTEYEPPEIPTSTGTAGNSSSFPVTPATPTAFEKRDVGMVLEVLPVADADKRYVDLTINPSFVELDGFVNFGSPIRSAANSPLGLGAVPVELTPNSILMPVFSTRRANTQITVADGTTIAIGGLMTESIENVEDKVPVFGDIPWVGRLFRSTSRQSTKTALVFLVQVELLDPTGRPFRDR